MKHLKVIILALIVGCTTAPEYIPEPPAPETVYSDPIKSIDWIDAKTVIYAYACTAGDGSPEFTLTFNTKWNVSEPNWVSDVCPVR